MVNEKKKTYEISKTAKNNMENFQLFTTHTDKYTQNIFEISDPYEFLLPQYMEQVGSGELSRLFILNGNNLRSLLSTSINLKELLFSNGEGFIYQLDFGSLSNDTKEKIESGIYKIGNSKKIEGNMRAVIVDTTNSNQRVEDLTLKEVSVDKNIARSLTDLAIQVQLKQIYEILSDIQETQDYQLHWDRNNSILVPFFTARTQVIEFQKTDDLNRKTQLLHDASCSMEQTVSAIKADLISNKEQIEKMVKKPVHRYKTFERHANFILSDINLLLKIVGMQAYMDLALDNESMAAERFESLKHIFELYSSRTIGETGNSVLITLEHLPFINNLISDSERIVLPSMLEIIHDNYRYSSGNKDLWLNINDEIQEGIQLSLLSEGELDYEA
ncbi:hypothetical protein [Enterococcus faecalis]|uniref:hypothetical protein n=1 Tax=Enterococcus faecalis TaxID=1351 RepID=UPI0019272ECD|nr:hypothetical protein [Enterococcus faecalis]EGO8088240.1 hypothetical protein [Enterococcus faecalis]EGO8235378.1 hypothetical protein [Enterococcus faecalis]EGO8503456.1 hypothetical protein [Enterococcus faecalis]MCD5080868.1 hypothetical protein [Enterococcus faecalis]MCU7779209.1 hypothetical protein [Enterococcus faecalis]